MEIESSEVQPAYGDMSGAMAVDASGGAYGAPAQAEFDCES